MPTNKKQIKVTLTAAELRSLRRELRKGESLSNLLRQKLGLPPLKHGGKRSFQAQK